jgi:two-component system nitrate/nitrite response regulator NarL
MLEAPMSAFVSSAASGSLDMSENLRIAILDDHQGIIDGYMYRLSGLPGIEIVGAATSGEALQELLAAQPVDVLLLDIHVPMSRSNANAYPVLHVLSQLHDRYPDLAVLVISMHDARALIRAVMQAGASGYILKDDAETIRNLAAVVRAVAHGGTFFSERAKNEWLRTRPGEEQPQLTARQSEVLSMAAAFPDLSAAELAERLAVAPSTLRNMLSNIYEKLGVRNRSAAILKARHLGLITPFPPQPSPPDSGQYLV